MSPGVTPWGSAGRPSPWLLGLTLYSLTVCPLWPRGAARGTDPVRPQYTLCHGRSAPRSRPGRLLTSSPITGPRWRHGSPRESRGHAGKWGGERTVSFLGLFPRLAASRQVPSSHGDHPWFHLSLIRQLRICFFFRAQPEVLKGVASLACGLSPAFLPLLAPGFLFPSVTCSAHMFAPHVQPVGFVCRAAPPAGMAQGSQCPAPGAP